MHACLVCSCLSTRQIKTNPGSRAREDHCKAREALVLCAPELLQQLGDRNKKLRAVLMLPWEDQESRTLGTSSECVLYNLPKVAQQVSHTLRNWIHISPPSFPSHPELNPLDCAAFFKTQETKCRSLWELQL